jgi:hypothetical protein
MNIKKIFSKTGFFIWLLWILLRIVVLLPLVLFDALFGASIKNFFHFLPSKVRKFFFILERTVYQIISIVFFPSDLFLKNKKTVKTK